MPFVPGKVDFASLELRLAALGTGRMSPGEGVDFPYGLTRARGASLDLMGQEYAITRRLGETDEQMRSRIRGICGSCGALTNRVFTVNGSSTTPESHKEGCLGALADAANFAETVERERLALAANFARLAAAQAIPRRRR